MAWPLVVLIHPGGSDSWTMAWPLAVLIHPGGSGSELLYAPLVMLKHPGVLTVRPLYTLWSSWYTQGVLAVDQCTAPSDVGSPRGSLL